ncbi:MAG: hypothetical protein NVS3B18_01480 [Candidatus Dormibacteria bacterium]
MRAWRARAGGAAPPPADSTGGALGRRLPPREVIGIGFLALLTGLGALGAELARYLSYRSPTYDLGFFDQVVEQTAGGHYWHSSFIAYSFLGEHWEPVLLLPAALDRFAPSPVWLLGMQAVALGLAPVAAWRLGRAWLGPGAGWAAALATSFSPLLARAALFDFHAEALTPALALFALDAAARNHRLRFVLLLGSLALIKEDALLVAAGAGWIAWCADRRVLGLLLAAAALAAFAVIVGVVMPSERLGAPGDLADRYTYLGGRSVGAMVRGALAHPGRPLGRLGSRSSLMGAGVALLPLAALPLLAGWPLLGALPALLVALLSADAGQASLRYPYGLESFPLLLACALLGWRALLGSRGELARPPRVIAPRAAARGSRPRQLSGRVVGTALVATTMLGAALVSAPTLADRLGHLSLARHAAVEWVLAGVPPQAEVSAQTGLVPHLSARARLFEFPAGFGTSYILVDDRGPISDQARAHGYAARRAQLPGAGYRPMRSAAGVTLWVR